MKLIVQQIEVDFSPYKKYGVTYTPEHPLAVELPDYGHAEDGMLVMTPGEFITMLNDLGVKTMIGSQVVENKVRQELSKT